MSNQPPQESNQPQLRPCVNFLQNAQRTAPGAPRCRPGSSTTAAPIERVTTIQTEEVAGTVPGTAQKQPPPGIHRGPRTADSQPHDGADSQPAEPQQHDRAGSTPTRTQLQRRPKPMGRPPEKKQLTARCLILCGILFLLLIIVVGLAVLVIYLLYRPQAPRLSVDTATLNAGYLDKINNGAVVLNSDLTLLVIISNPNTKIDVVLHYMELDLLFQGNMIATQAVWPAPLHQRPGGSVLRSVQLIASEVTMTKEDISKWQNSTSKGGPVPLQLTGRFRTQLNFGRWMRFTYWFYPRCNLKLDPPPSGALRLARC